MALKSHGLNTIGLLDALDLSELNYYLVLIHNMHKYKCSFMSKLKHVIVFCVQYILT